MGYLEYYAILNLPDRTNKWKQDTHRTGKTTYVAVKGQNESNLFGDDHPKVVCRLQEGVHQVAGRGFDS